MTVGRIVGGVVTTAQGTAEMFGGGGMVSGGAAACGTAVLCPAGAGAITVGGTVAVHGEMVAVNGLNGLAENVSTLAASGGSDSDGTQWQFLNGRKANQAIRRGWGNIDIQNVLDNAVETKPTMNLANGNSATVYYRADGHYVVRDDVTGDIFHFSDIGDSGWIDPFGDVITPRGN